MKKNLTGFKNLSGLYYLLSIFNQSGLHEKKPVRFILSIKHLLISLILKNINILRLSNLKQGSMLIDPTIGKISH